MTISTMKCHFLEGTSSKSTSNAASLARPFTRRRFRSVAFAKTVSSADSKTAGASGWAINGNRPTSPKAWEIMSTTLRKSGVKLISSEELVVAQKRGAKVVDIRPLGEYESGRIPGAAHAEFLRLIEGWDLMKVARRGVYAFFGILNGTEYNDRFFDEFAAVVPGKKKPVVIYCNIGGTLEPTGPSKFGRQSRSLSAAYELINAGYTNVQVLNGGLNDWKKAEREIE